jgi:hypothetical protein
MAPHLNRKRGPRRTSACFPGSLCGPPSASPLASSQSAKRYHRSAPRLPCASAARPEANRVSAQTKAPRRSPRHLAQRASTATIEDPTLLALSKDPLQCIDQGTSLRVLRDGHRPIMTRSPADNAAGGWPRSAVRIRLRARARSVLRIGPDPARCKQPLQLNVVDGEVHYPTRSSTTFAGDRKARSIPRFGGKQALLELFNKRRSPKALRAVAARDPAGIEHVHCARSRSRRSRSSQNLMAQTCWGFNARLAPSFRPAFHGRRSFATGSYSECSIAFTSWPPLAKR